MAAGKVYLVGAGPGDPGLLTLRARRLLAAADAVVFDRLLSPRLLGFVSSRAVCYYAGKAPGAHEMEQEDIHALLISLARAGKTVVRLKGGDPFVFGRGGEEALALTAAGVAWEVVPGVTSAVAVPAYAGIPVTHRDISPAFTVVTGHACSQAGGVDWEGLARTGGTIVVMMGMAHLGEIAARLVAAGRPPGTPVAVIRWGTRAAQEVLRAELGTVAAEVAKRRLRSPAVVVIGEVARLGEVLAWAQARPLFGRRVLVVGDVADEAADAADVLEALGAEVYDWTLAGCSHPLSVSPLWAAMEIVSPSGAAPGFAAEPPAPGVIAMAVAKGERVLWWPSPLAVDLWFAAWREAGRDVRQLAGWRLAAAEPRVAVRLSSYGIVADDVAPHPPAGAVWVPLAVAKPDMVRLLAWWQAQAEGVGDARPARPPFARAGGGCSFDAVWVLSDAAWMVLTGTAAAAGHRLTAVRLLARDAWVVNRLRAAGADAQWAPDADAVAARLTEPEEPQAWPSEVAMGT
ncbi:hypothetical protein GCM10010885_13110 [Alicyclobacillus cellulosilyticus]|uniref:Uroporphyrinogen-III C-methyltransferase n=1 Tax=Alicyclobacillus cellulosilyticus TaxID=1003997 RepID=A0A917NJJ4_9BACL|nr:uroporphyrinogen-III C-methyltransferase [Alicyclobacillus cellulosilyticus]GGJ05396.1 hypothetical protein GCM10010885_13110 [Alicyclobacillus cellulosilyticus]